MEIKDKIKKDLLEDALENYNVCLRIVRSNSEITSKILIQYFPFLSLNLLDIIDEFELSEIADEYYSQDVGEFTKLLHSSRAILKQDTTNTKYAENKKEILKYVNQNYNYLIKDYNIIQKIRIKFQGQKDFAVYSYKGVPFFNNIQNLRFIDFFLDDDVINGEELSRFSSNAVNFLQTIISGFIDTEEYKEKFEEKIQEKLSDFDMNDYFVYEKARSDLFVNALKVDQNVFLFNLLCLVNSANYLYPQVLRLGRHPQLRMKFITYLIVVKGLWIYKSKFNNLPKNLELLINNSNLIFTNEKNRNDFRNNIFHFGLPSGAKYEVNIITSLVKHYLKMTLEEFNLFVTEELEIFIKECNLILFGEHKKFLGTNCWSFITLLLKDFIEN